jgi:predicted kinase
VRRNTRIGESPTPSWSAGVEATERWLGARGEEAAEALSQLREAVARGDLEGFSAEEARAAHRRYYLDDAP